MADGFKALADFGCRRLIVELSSVRDVEQLCWDLKAPVGKFKSSLQRAERFRMNMAVIIAAFVLVGTVSVRYPLAFLGLLVLGLAYAIYRIIKERNQASTED